MEDQAVHALPVKADPEIMARHDIARVRFFQRQGLVIPDDISIVGFDGCREASEITPKLTTIAQNNLLRAQAAISLLLKMIDHSETTENLSIPVKLTIGQSVRRLN